MDRQLIAEWNAVVPVDGHVFHLGDFSLSTKAATVTILEQLHGTIYLVAGNHDRTARRLTEHFAWVKDYYELKVGPQLIVLSHYPLQVWNKGHYSSWHLHGHCHGRLPSVGKRMDVGVGVEKEGVDSVWRPVAVDEIERCMQHRKYIQHDHHAVEAT